MNNITKILDELKALSANKSEQGSKFEKFIQKVFLTIPTYGYEEVWTWNEFPYSDTHDIGIDLVAKKKDCDEYVAIQCKFYDPKSTVSKEDIDTFLSASSMYFDVDGIPHTYSERVLVSTTDKWSSNADETVRRQVVPISKVGLKELQDFEIDWDSFTLDTVEDMKLSPKKKLRPHQVAALDDVIKGFEFADRGKLIMACGTGKTFTSLKIVEKLTGGKGNVLFLVPSISLLNQTLVEWTIQCSYEFNVYAICSDPKASKSNDSAESKTDLIIPATTDIDRLQKHYDKVNSDKKINFFFSTYQSIDVISDFQKQTGIVFDIAVCDEAHRTTGVALANKEESNFIKIHSDTNVCAKKRLYMTATPRIYGDKVKSKAEDNNAWLYSMDDENLFGREFHRLGFSDAISMGLLTDYKVIILAVDKAYANRICQSQILSNDSEVKLEDSYKILGCLSGLSKLTPAPTEDDEYFSTDPSPMKRAVAFNGSIEKSKRFIRLFAEIEAQLKINNRYSGFVDVEFAHVDGTDNALYRKGRIDWLKERIPDNTCRILSNARCLSEGIDVPALDAVIFLNPRNSMVDVIQSVGRVMRKSEGKKYGYIILPIGVSADATPETVLDKNEEYKVVWDILQALRAHDDRFNNTINKIDLNKKKPDNIQFIGVGDFENNFTTGYQMEMDFNDLAEWKDSIYAKIVQKCGDRKYWEKWSKEIAEIANLHITQIHNLLNDKDIKEKFDKFLTALQNNLNSSIKEDDAVEMLAEHLITKPVFDALFENYEFVKHNPVSKIMQEMLDILDEKALDKEQETLDRFYQSVKDKAKVDNAEAKQTVIKDLYELFFKNAFPKQVEKLGIVYTPVEVIDFIINSVDAVLKKEFHSSLNDKNVHILDPFTGTGTFIVRLLQSGLIDKDKLLYKYTNEIHANEIVLLAYYIAAINIEETFHELMGNEEYTQFEGIVLTDTFAMTERQHGGQEYLSDIFEENSARAEKQLKAPITVIIGNPPYSVGQKSGNDDNQNTSYPILDKKIAESYVAKSKSTLTRNAYDSYIKAFRWATDRIGDNGIIGFVSNGSYLDGVSLDGFRQCLNEEFTHIWVFNLRGDQRTIGDISRREGGKIFGSGSRTPVAITILVKRKGVVKDRFIRYHDIGDYLSREQKLAIISEFGDIGTIKWSFITPNENNDWINQRNQSYINFVALGDKKKQEQISIYLDNYASGLSTNRDVWLYNYSAEQAKTHAEQMIAFYNSERERCFAELKQQNEQGLISVDDKKVADTYLTNIRSTDATNISWSAGLTTMFCRNSYIEPIDWVRITTYRPFCKKHLVYNKDIIERPSKWDSILPDDTFENLIICISGAPIKKNFSVLLTNTIQDLNFMEHSICFPMYMYDREEKLSLHQTTLFDITEEDTVTYKKHSAISNVALERFQKAYGNCVTKEQIFYYIYAVFHNKEYIAKYQDNLSKEMARIPLLENFFAFADIGRKLAKIHLNYEDVVSPTDLGLEITKTAENYKVEKMRFPKVGKDSDKSTIIFNDSITISNIPERAYEYVVNGRSAIEWIMESYRIKTDKDSGITDDPNDYGDEKYIYNLLISIISVSLKTLDIIDSMPEYKEI